MEELARVQEVGNAWDTWLSVTRERCHLHYEIVGDSLETHLTGCYSSALSTISRVEENIKPSKPTRILEVGCSVGFNCFALRERFPGAKVFGIEPDFEAFQVANAMVQASGFKDIEFFHGVGEQLPFEDASFDLIVCHTVIEHVADVEACIREIARVLKPLGILHLEAPNYLWPVEPHLGIIILPLCPKPLMRLLARLQGAGASAHYADHLKLVHPFLLERLFRVNGLSYHNHMREKMLTIAGGEMGQVEAYKGLASLLAVLQKAGLADLLVHLACSIGVYPSVLYSAKRSL